MRKFGRTQRNYLIIGLCAILVIMGVGYAAFSSQLKITGTSNIDSTWSVKITSITPTDIVGEAKDKSEVTSYTDTTATFGTSLKLPNDSITYNIVIENQGSLDAKLDTITKTDTNNSAISFETSGVEEGDLLRAGENVTMKVKVTYTPGDSQPTNLESNLKVELNYSQAPNGYVPPVTGPTVGGITLPIASDGSDGLYQDEYEAGRYIYKGANPNNYITFNNETWRILSIEADGRIKIVKDELLPDRVWDSTGSNNWDRPSDIKTYLNGEYLDSITANKDKIEPSTWSIGAVTWDNDDLAGRIANENGTQSQEASVGLITASEYLRANSNKELCGNLSLNNSNDTTCRTTNWLVKGTMYWTLSPDAVYSSHVWTVYGNGDLGRTSDDTGARNSHGVRPALYLSSDISLSGSGTAGDPYKIN